MVECLPYFELISGVYLQLAGHVMDLKGLYLLHLLFFKIEFAREFLYNKFPSKL